LGELSLDREGSLGFWRDLEVSVFAGEVASDESSDYGYGSEGKE